MTDDGDQPIHIETRTVNTLQEIEGRMAVVLMEQGGQVALMWGKDGMMAPQAPGSPKDELVDLFLQSLGDAEEYGTPGKVTLYKGPGWYSLVCICDVKKYPRKHRQDRKSAEHYPAPIVERRPPPTYTR